MLIILMRIYGRHTHQYMYRYDNKNKPGSRSKMKP